MGNIGTSIIKIAVAAGGAVLGVLLARWGDEFIASRFQEKSEVDKTRYEQGLMAQQPLQPIQPPIVVQSDNGMYPGGAEDQRHE